MEEMKNEQWMCTKPGEILYLMTDGPDTETLGRAVVTGNTFTATLQAVMMTDREGHCIFQGDAREVEFGHLSVDISGREEEFPLDLSAQAMSGAEGLEICGMDLAAKNTTICVSYNVEARMGPVMSVHQHAHLNTPSFCSTEIYANFLESIGMKPKTDEP